MNNDNGNDNNVGRAAHARRDDGDAFFVWLAQYSARMLTFPGHAMSRAKQRRLRLRTTRHFQGRRNGTALQSAARIRGPFVFFCRVVQE